MAQILEFPPVKHGMEFLVIKGISGNIATIAGANSEDVLEHVLDLELPMKRVIVTIMNSDNSLSVFTNHDGREEAAAMISLILKLL